MAKNATRLSIQPNTSESYSKIKNWCGPHKILGSNIVSPKFYRRLQKL